MELVSFHKNIDTEDFVGLLNDWLETLTQALNKLPGKVRVDIPRMAPVQTQLIYVTDVESVVLAQFSQQVDDARQWDVSIHNALLEYCHPDGWDLCFPRFHTYDPLAQG